MTRMCVCVCVCLFVCGRVVRVLPFFETSHSKQTCAILASSRMELDLKADPYISITRSEKSNRYDISRPLFSKFATTPKERRNVCQIVR